jgi:hypothetical protein
MRALLHFAIPFALLAASCEPAPDPAAPDGGSPRLSAQRAGGVSVFPNVDGGFGPFVLVSCDEGYDLIYQQVGTVTIIETTDKADNVTRLQFVWNLTASYTNSVTGYSISGPSYGPDQTTFNSDGTSRFIQVGIIVHLKTPDGENLVDAGRLEFLIDVYGDISLVEMSGPHPIHEGFPERPVLCALINH